MTISIFSNDSTIKFFKFIVWLTIVALYTPTDNAALYVYEKKAVNKTFKLLDGVVVN